MVNKINKILPFLKQSINYLVCCPSSLFIVSSMLTSLLFNDLISSLILFLFSAIDCWLTSKEDSKVFDEFIRISIDLNILSLIISSLLDNNIYKFGIS